ncbi:MAG TPA: hypothetical protein VHQ41_03685, partial [Patescibacteria group bacterium]|nr:hypothetical protein [Patescibacteria group bacterium]
MPLLFLVTILLSQAALLIPATFSKAEAAGQFCIYNPNITEAGGGYATRAASSITINVQEKLVNGKPTGLSGDLDVQYAPSENNYIDSESCNSAVSGYLTFNGGLLQGVITKSNIPLTDLSLRPASGALKLHGHFDIPDLKAVLSNAQAIQSYDGSGTNYYKSFLTFKILENGKTTEPYTIEASGNHKFSSAYSPTVNLYGCASLVCENHGANSVGSDPVGDSALLMQLSTISIQASTNVAAASKALYVPASKQKDQYINFVRIYYDTDAKQIVPFDIIGSAVPQGPDGKTIYIKSGSNTTKVFLKDANDPTFKPHSLVALGSGVFNKTITLNSSGGYGCQKDTFTTNYLYGNQDFAYNLCNTRIGAKVESGLALKIDKNNDVESNLHFEPSALADLKANIQVTCTDPVAGTGCDDKVNIVQVAPFLSIENNFALDDSVAGVFTSFRKDLASLANYISYWDGVPLVYKPTDFYIQIYPTKKAWEAHKDDPPPSSVPDAKPETSTAQATTGAADQSLYGFIVRVISDIIVWLQSIIYAIFAYFVVPVINALLQIRPYQDVFVNIIYPGWLILRNVANIFFILSLLIMGLRTLFQRSGAGARSFIVKLILMALLVNFSLVIAQGIVGIADTVQSQFLPANSKVIEALGAKLMVEPL